MSSSAVMLSYTTNIEDENNNFGNVMNSNDKENNEENEDSSNIVQPAKYKNKDSLLTKGRTSMSIGNKSDTSLNSSPIQGIIIFQ